MQRERIAVDLQRPPEGNDVHTRLNWLLAVNGQEAHRRVRFRYVDEEEELLLMRRPLDIRRAYALFGLLLGLLPPAAIFIKMFGYGFSFGPDPSALLFLACVAMNLVCAGVGYAMGGAVSSAAESAERSGWVLMQSLLALIGIAWGAVTGFAGGLIFVGIGAIFGAVFAIPIGAIAFMLFGPLHRAMARGDMIDARHFWPLATGVTALCAALVLGLGK